jgi:hypothetical protein
MERQTLFGALSSACCLLSQFLRPDALSGVLLKLKERIATFCGQSLAIDESCIPDLFYFIC